MKLKLLFFMLLASYILTGCEMQSLENLNQLNEKEDLMTLPMIDPPKASQGVSFHHGITGIYHDPRFGGQGLEIHAVKRGDDVQVYAYLFTHTYERDQQGNLVPDSRNPSKRKTWFLLDGSVLHGEDTAELDIYAPTGGRPFVKSHLNPEYKVGSSIGKISLKLNSCTSAYMQVINISRTIKQEDKDALLGLNYKGGEYNLERLTPIPFYSGQPSCVDGSQIVIPTPLNSLEKLTPGHSATLTDAEYNGQGLDIFHFNQAGKLLSNGYLYTYEYQRSESGGSIPNMPTRRTWLYLTGKNQAGSRQVEYTVNDVKSAPYEASLTSRIIGQATLNQSSCEAASFQVSPSLNHPDLAGMSYNNLYRLDPIQIDSEGNLTCSDLPHGDDGEVGPADCSQRQPPAGMTRQMRGCSLSNSWADCTSYKDIFGGFPGTTSFRFLQIGKPKYIALEFEVDRPISSAKFGINTEALQHVDITYTPPTWSVSTCPGDFNKQAIEEDFGRGCFRTGFTGARFELGSGDYRDSPSVCGIDFVPGQKYYLNITYTTDQIYSGQDFEFGCNVLEDEMVCGMQAQPINIRGDWP